MIVNAFRDYAHVTQEDLITPMAFTTNTKCLTNLAFTLIWPSHLMPNVSLI